MKKLFIFALAGLALASCSDDEENVVSKNGAKKDASVLSFSTYTAGATRAGVVTSAEVKTSGFQVAAWYDGGLYFNAGETATVAADGKYDTDGDTYYWPSFSAGSIGFRAFNKGVGAAWTPDKEYESIDFTVAATAADQKDLVIAYAEATEKPADGVQPLNFTHALSKVNFSFVGATDANKYTINKVEVIAAGRDNAVMTFKNTTEITGTKTDGDEADNTQAACVAWDNVVPISSTDPLVKKDGTAAANQGVLYTYVDEDVVVDGKTVNKLDNNFMLIPQSHRIAVRVYYKVETLKKGSTTEYNLIGNCGYEATDKKGHHASQAGYDADNGAILGCKTVVIDLATDAPAWEAGKSYRFTMTLPDDNFIGDKSNDGVADGLDDTDPANKVDLDGDNDTDPSEFDILTPIRFSVTVSAWETAENNSNITIK